MEHYDIFISYRREGSEYLPMHMKYLLEQRGYRAFFDMESMRSGMFNKQIYTVIEQCSDMVLILPPNALDRCINEGDWLRLEITHALKCKKNIIPVMMRGFAGFPENLPAEISQVRYCQGVTASSEYFDSVMDRICGYLHAPKPCLICPHCGQPTPANFAAKTELCERCGEAFVVAKAAPAMQVGQAAPQPVVLPQRVPNAQPIAASDPADFDIRDGKLVKYKGSGGAVVIPDGVTSIDEGAFFRCNSLTGITIPDSVNGIQRYAFYKCSSLASITISDRVSEIGTGVFADCDSLTKITVSPNNSKFCVVDGILYTKDRRRLICCPGGRQGEVVIPDGVTSIDESAFQGCKSLTSITIPNSVTSIGESAFGECKALNTISVSPYNTAYCDIDGVLYTKDRKKLICCPGGRQGEVVIPNGVTCIGNQAFALCVSLTSITIPDSVTCIGDEAFSLCKSLTGIRIPDHVLSIGSRAFRDCRSLTFINIPNGVPCIGECTFMRCQSLTGITIPGSVKSIGSAAFFVCKSLTDVTIPDSVTHIGPQAFSVCQSLTSINIPSSVTTIGHHAFQECTSLESVTILGNATIDHEAFADCTALREVSIARGAKYSRDVFRNTPYQKRHPFA